MLKFIAGNYSICWTNDKNWKSGRTRKTTSTSSACPNSSSIINSWEEFSQLLEYGSSQRITSQNSANSESSRSHAILQIALKEGKQVFGKISFIDLAGNERGADHTDMKKQTRIDGTEINKSLLSLKECRKAHLLRGTKIMISINAKQIRVFLIFGLQDRRIQMWFF